MDDTADTGTEKAHGRQGQSKALAACKAELSFIDIAVIHGLPGALSIAKGQQNACRIQQPRHCHCRNQRDGKAHHSLQKIGADGGDAGIEYLRSAFAGKFSPITLQRARNKAQRQGMVGDHFQVSIPFPAEKARFKQLFPGNSLIDHGKNQQQPACQNGGRDQRCFQNLYGFFQRIGNQQTKKQHRKDIEKTPHAIIPKICHFFPPPLHFYICGTDSDISTH